MPYMNTIWNLAGDKVNRMATINSLTPEKTHVLIGKEKWDIGCLVSVSWTWNIITELYYGQNHS